MKHRQLTGAAEQGSFEARFSTLDRSPSSSGLHAQRRHAPRYRVDLDVSLGSDHNFYTGLAENMSAGGVFVATHLLKPVGEIVQLTIHLPESNATWGCHLQQFLSYLLCALWEQTSYVNRHFRQRNLF